MFARPTRGRILLLGLAVALVLVIIGGEVRTRRYARLHPPAIIPEISEPIAPLAAESPFLPGMEVVGWLIIAAPLVSALLALVIMMAEDRWDLRIAGSVSDWVHRPAVQWSRRLATGAAVILMTIGFTSSNDKVALSSAVLLVLFTMFLGIND